MKGKRLSMKQTLDESMFEDTFTQQDARAVDNVIDPINTENAVVSIPQGHAARWNTLQKRRAEIRKAFEQRAKDVEEFMKINNDRSPRTLSKDAIHRDAYKKAMLAESLFEDADPIEVEDEEMPDNITEKELIDDAKEPAEKLVDLIGEYKNGDRPVSEKGKEFINNVFEAIYNLLDLMGDEEEPTDMAEALNKFRRSRLKEAVTLTEAKHWSLNLKQVLDGIISPNAKIKLFTTDSEILTPNYVSVDEARLNNAQNIKVLEIIGGEEPNSLDITVSADDVYADDIPQQEDNLNEGAPKKFLDDGSLNPNFARSKSPFRYLLRVIDSEWKELYTNTAVYPNKCMQYLDRVHSQLDTAKYADAQRIEVIRYNTAEDLLADTYRDAPADKATIIYEEEKQEDGSWKVVDNKLNDQDYMYSDRVEDDEYYTDVPSDYVPNRRNRLYADLISCGGTDKFSISYRKLRLIPHDNFKPAVKVLLSAGRYADAVDGGEISRPPFNDNLIEIETTKFVKAQFVQKVCACYDCEFKLEKMPAMNRKGEYNQNKKDPFKIKIKVNNPKEIITELDHPEKVPELLNWVNSLTAPERKTAPTEPIANEAPIENIEATEIPNEE